MILTEEVQVVLTKFVFLSKFYLKPNLGEGGGGVILPPPPVFFSLNNSEMVKVVTL